MSHVTPAMARQMMETDNVTLPAGAGAAFRGLFMVAGLGLMGATFWAGWSGDAHTAKIALHAWHIGFLFAVGIAVGALGFVMIFQQTNAGWCTSIRRQFENMMASVWAPMLIGVGLVAAQYLYLNKFGKDGDAFLFNWMNAAKYAGDHLLEKKAGYLNVPFFLVRAAVYFLVWLGLGGMLYGMSRRQDDDGDKWHTARARKLSAVGLILFAFTTAFAGFDWIMGLDFHWYSTMLGVCFFAGNAVSCLALVTLVLFFLRKFGRLAGCFTEEHQHDLSKILFAFVVFWAYVSFSQYFLIWYANIPEETAFFVMRKQGPWEKLSWALPIGHFILPFLFLLPKPRRRSMTWAALWSVWMLVMHGLDLFFMVRPEAGESFHWADATGIAGPVLFMLGVVMWRVTSGPLVPLKDPRLSEALAHKNYV